MHYAGYVPVEKELPLYDTSVNITIEDNEVSDGSVSIDGMIYCEFDFEPSDMSMDEDEWREYGDDRGYSVAKESLSDDIVVAFAEYMDELNASYRTFNNKEDVFLSAIQSILEKRDNICEHYLNI